MSATQRLIKYAAIVLAILIIASMVSLGVSIISSILGVIEDDDAPESIKVYNFNSEEISSLYVELDAASLEIKRGDALTVTADENHVNVKQSGSALYIKDSTLKHRELQVVLTLPDIALSEVEIDMDAGILKIDALTADTLELEFDAGDVEIGLISIAKSAEISGGAGKLVIQDGTLTSLDLTVSVGKSEIRARIAEGASLDCDLGSLDLSLIGAADEYAFEVSNDIGTVSIDGVSVSEGTVGEGATTLTLDCAMGTVNITTDN